MALNHTDNHRTEVGHRGRGIAGMVLVVPLGLMCAGCLLGTTTHEDLGGRSQGQMDVGKEMVVERDLPGAPDKPDYSTVRFVIPARVRTIPRGTIVRIVQIEQITGHDLWDGSPWTAIGAVVVDGPLAGQVLEFGQRFSSTSPALSPRTSHALHWEDAAVPGHADRAAIESAIADPEQAVRWHAARAIGELGPAAVPLLPALARALHDPDIDVRIEAAESCARLGPTAAPLLWDLQALQDKIKADNGYHARELWTAIYNASWAIHPCTTLPQSRP
jgi:hypothetical protein